MVVRNLLELNYMGERGVVPRFSRVRLHCEHVPPLLQMPHFGALVAHVPAMRYCDSSQTRYIRLYFVKHKIGDIVVDEEVRVLE